MSVGEHIKNFDFPVCNSFRPTVLDGQLCYQFDVNSIETNTTSGQPYLMFILDYNQDREYKTLTHDGDEHKDDPTSLYEMEADDATKDEAMIYIETLGKIIKFLNFLHKPVNRIVLKIIFLQIIARWTFFIHFHF